MSERERPASSRVDWRSEVPPGRSSFDLTLGGVRVRVIDLPAAWDPFVIEQYAPFAQQVDGSIPATLTIIASMEQRPIVVPLPPAGEMTVLQIERVTPQRYRIDSHWQSGWVDFASGRGELRLADRSWDRFSMSVENFLRVAFQLQLLEREMFLFHTAAVLDRDRCFLFFGHSGAGKSTATALSAPRLALSDDMVLIDLSGNAPRVEAVPFYMMFPPDQRQRGRWPIAAALRLRQAPHDRVVQLTAARAVATVAASVPFIHEFGLQHDRLTELVTQFVAGTPVADLEFTRSARFWELLSVEFPSSA